ncbi:MAG: sel1 repeat family protein [Akkermansia sp.]|nr:sel1 repeat family protein [Akkermansia sp.]
MNMKKKALLLFSFTLLAAACSEDSDNSAVLTPQQMYEKAAALLKPNTEHEQPDYTGAFRLLEQAAAADYVPAMLDLAGVYLEGSRDGSVSKDRANAFQWYTRAAQLGSTDALYYCGFILLEDKKTAEAVTYLQRAAQKGLPEAQYQLGRLLLAQNSPEALPLIRAAATSQRASIVAAASYTMGTVFQNGKLGVQKDMGQAVEWYLRSADAGDRRAQHLVGLMYLLGENLPADEKKGEALLRLSAGQDYLPAIDALVRYLFDTDADAHAEEIRAWSERLQKLQKR